MTAALRFQGVVSGRTLALPDLGALEGKRVEVVVTEVDEGATAAPPARKLGTLRGFITIAEDFDAPLEGAGFED
jgi:hypothetical protein